MRKLSQDLRRLRHFEFAVRIIAETEMEKVNSAKCTAGPFSQFARNENEERELLNENSSNMRAKNKGPPFGDETQLLVPPIYSAIPNE